MFSLSVHGDDVIINIDFNGFHIELEPESLEAIKKVDLTSDHGTFNSRPTNGQFYITWSSDIIKICVAKYGDGNGGTMQLSIPSSQAIISELKNVLINLKKQQEIMEIDQ
jgi:hypothetical protein